MAQYDLGIFYYSGLTFIRNIKKSIYYFKLVSKNGSRRASFCYGFLLHEGRDIKRNILKAIHYYNDASSFNNKHAKNNLGIIYKNGFGDEIISRVGNAIEYFEEAIQQGDDCLSMYNLAHIYIYNKSFEKDFDKSLELLIISSRKFHHSLVLLCFVLIKKFGTDMDAIQNQIEKISNKTDNLSSKVFENIRNMQLYNKKIFESLYESCRTKYFYTIFNEMLIYHQNYKILMIDSPKNKNGKKITSLFYEGFGINF